MNMINSHQRICQDCQEDIFNGENCFGITKYMKYLCMDCFEKRKDKKGIVPVTCTITEEWKELGLKSQKELPTNSLIFKGRFDMCNDLKQAIGDTKRT